MERYLKGTSAGGWAGNQLVHPYEKPVPADDHHGKHRRHHDCEEQEAAKLFGTRRRRGAVVDGRHRVSSFAKGPRDSDGDSLAKLCDRSAIRSGPPLRVLRLRDARERLGGRFDVRRRSRGRRCRDPRSRRSSGRSRRQGASRSPRRAFAAPLRESSFPRHQLHVAAHHVLQSLHGHLLFGGCRCAWFNRAREEAFAARLG